MTVTPPSNIPVSVDYTSKEFYSLREELIARIQDRVPNWTANDPADFGVALVEAFAYMGDILSYYIDRNANESFINTATQRDSVLNIARTYGYIPAGYRQSLVDLTFTNTSASAVTLPEGTVISGDIIDEDTVTTIYFTTVSEVEIPEQIGATPGTETVTAYHGRSVLRVSDDATVNGELIGVSTGLPGIVLELGEVPVVDNSIEIYVQDGDTFTKWTAVQNIMDYDPTDQVFEIFSDEDDRVFINFGDGISGVIPTLYSEIRAIYTVGGGTAGNVTANTLDTLSYVPGLSESQVSALASTLSVTNLNAAIAGADPESTDIIRVSAPLALRSNNRAITLEDFSTLALAIGGIGKANATASVWTSVTVYIAPTRSETDTDLAPGLDESNNPTAEYDLIKEEYESYLVDKVLIGTSVTVSPPEYIDAVVTVQYSLLTGYETDVVEAGIKSRLLTDFSYVNNTFEETIYPEDIEFSLQQVPGVKVVRVTQLYRFGESVALTTLQGDPDQIFRFQEANIGIGPVV